MHICTRMLLKYIFQKLKYICQKPGGHLNFIIIISFKLVLKHDVPLKSVAYPFVYVHVVVEKVVDERTRFMMAQLQICRSQGGRGRSNVISQKVY